MNFVQELNIRISEQSRANFQEFEDIISSAETIEDLDQKWVKSMK